MARVSARYLCCSLYDRRVHQPYLAAAGRKAGYKIDEIPKTWDAFYDFFKDVQKKLRDQRVRNVYGLGFQVTTNGGDPNAFFD